MDSGSVCKMSAFSKMHKLCKDMSQVRYHEQPGVGHGMLFLKAFGGLELYTDFIKQLAFMENHYKKHHTNMTQHMKKKTYDSLVRDIGI